MIWMDVDIALASVPVNAMPLIDSTDFKTIEDAVVFNQAGLALFWHFTTTAGVTTSTAVTPTSGGDYHLTDQSTSGMYAIEIPASGGASANNNTEGFGWFTGVATGILPWAGPIIGFRAAGLNNALVDSAYSATRGLAGTAVPDAAADAAGGLPISDAGGLDLDARLDAAITSRLAPATPGRTLVVDANGLADANTVKVGPTGSGTSQTAGDIIGDTNDIQTRLPAALVSGRMDSSVGAMAANTFTASAVASDAVTEVRSIVSGTADSGTTTTMVDAARTEADTDYWKDMAILFTSGTISGQARLITAFNAATDTITFSPATTQAVGTNTYEIISNVAAAGATAPTAAEVADAVWDEDATAHQTL